MEIGKETAPTELKTGHMVVGLVPTRLTSLGDIRAIKGVTVRADLGNTAKVFVGGVGVSADTGKRVGFPLEAGAIISIPADNPYHIWIVSTDDLQTVYWISL